MESLIVLAIIALILWVYWGRNAWRVHVTERALISIPGFVPNYYCIGANNTSIAISDANKMVAFIDRNGNHRMYNFANIVNVEICRNGVAYTKTNRGSQIVGAVIGNALFGPKGFKPGALTASTTTSERINALSLRVCVADLSNPSIEVVFYQGPAIEMTSRQFIKYSREINEWFMRLQLIITNP